jgi:hypothetical protein
MNMTAKIAAAVIKKNNNTFKPNDFARGVGFGRAVATPVLDEMSGADDEGLTDGERAEAGIGNPHEGQDAALSEMRCLHSGHRISATRLIQTENQLPSNTELATLRLAALCD